MTLPPGATLGRFQILEPLGQGGMATVYKAYQPSLEREVALKVLRPGFAQDAQFLERFEREAKSIGRLRHPHIVQVFDFDTSGGQYVLAMEFLEGGTLATRLDLLRAEGRRLEPQDAVRIIGEVAGALGYAHQQGVVHRDIKPSNVMLTRQDWAVVTDFGIARILDTTSHTQTGVGIGTPEYMSPEQGQGQEVDHRADIYSLGVLAYELLVGRVPFHADTPLAVIYMHVHDPLPLPSSANAAVGPQVERVLLKALAKDREQRFASAPDLGEALRAALDADSAGGLLPTMTIRKGGQPAPARHSQAAAGAAPGARPLLTSRPLVLGAAGALLIAAIAGAALVSGVRPLATPTTAPSTAPTAIATVGGAAPTAAASASATPGSDPGIPRGALIYEAKLERVGIDPDEAGLVITPGGDVKTIDGVVHLSVTREEVQSAVLFPSPPVAGCASCADGFIGEIQVSVRPGSRAAEMTWLFLERGHTDVDAIGFRVALDPRAETVKVVHTTDRGPSGPSHIHTSDDLTSPIPVKDMQSGRTLSLGIRVDRDEFTLFLDGAEVATGVHPALELADPALAVHLWGHQGADAEVMLHAVRVHALPEPAVARGPLVYQLKAEEILTDPDLATVFTLPDASAAQLRTEGGVLHMAVTGPRTEAAVHILAALPHRSVTEVALAFRPGSLGGDFVLVLAREGTDDRHEIVVDPAGEFAFLRYAKAAAETKLTPNIPIDGLQAGRRFTLGIKLDRGAYVLLLNDAIVASGTHEPLAAAGARPLELHLFGRARGDTAVTVHSVRVYALP